MTSFALLLTLATAHPPEFHAAPSAIPAEFHAAPDIDAEALPDAVDVTVAERPEDRPHLTAVLWDDGCRYGEQWEREALPKLEDAGWRIDVRRVPAACGLACPTFVMGDEKWEGYSTWNQHVADLKRMKNGGDAVGVARRSGAGADISTGSSAVTPAVSVQSVSAGREEVSPARRIAGPPVRSVSTPMHQHRCRFCGATFQHANSNVGNPRAHTCPACGRLEWGNRTELPRFTPTVSYFAAPVYRSGSCPGGRCP